MTENPFHCWSRMEIWDAKWNVASEDQFSVRSVNYGSIISVMPWYSGQIRFVFIYKLLISKWNKS